MERLFDLEALKATLKKDKKDALRVFEGERSVCGMRRLGPGEEGKAHVHPEADEWLICLEGEGEYSLDRGLSAAIQAGQIGFAPAGAVHGVKNTGDQALVYIFFVGQPYKPVFIEP